MYSLITPYLSKTIVTITGIVACVLGIATFGNALVFDRLFLSLCFVVAALSFFKDKNTFTIFCIIIIGILIEEFLWYFRQDHVSFKMLLYGISLVVFYRLRYDTFSKIAGVVLVVVIISEVYWWQTQYPAPRMEWGIVMLTMPVIIRHFIFFRPVYAGKLFPKWKEIEWINTDFQIYQIAVARIILEIAKTSEYLVRHVLEMKDVLLIYYSHPYLVHAINCYLLWIIFNESIRVIKKRQISA